MGKVIMSGIVPPLGAPVTGIQLGTIAEGSIVKLNENGSPVEFYVAKHDYESALNGSGRTLLVRKDIYKNLIWANASSDTAYATSNADSYLNSTYKNLLDAVVKTAIGTTKFYYTPGYKSGVVDNSNVTTLQRSVFLLSMTEYGLTITGASSYTTINTEGSKLPIASTLKIAYLSGTASDHWTRTPEIKSKGYVCKVRAAGTGYREGGSATRGIRPCFTLPSGACFDEETMLFNGKIV